jgi:hypothetical protein
MIVSTAEQFPPPFTPKNIYITYDLLTDMSNLVRIMEDILSVDNVTARKHIGTRTHFCSDSNNTLYKSLSEVMYRGPPLLASLANCGYDCNENKLSIGSAVLLGAVYIGFGLIFYLLSKDRMND